MNGADAPVLPAPAYRPAVDGLRAFAVLAVILYHAEVPGFGGGFVGVDVFFVISGYLITQLLLGGAGALGARLKIFYIRRARRILPALLVLLAAVTVVGLVVLLPLQLNRLGLYVASTPLLLANLTAWTSADYFATQHLAPPLAHLWSIAVEEQFYLVYPLVLLALARFWPRRRALALALIGLLSFALSVWGASRGSALNFYLPLTRAWELLIGAALVLQPWRPQLSITARHWIAVVAFAVLVAAVATYRTSLPYPGLPTVPICLATAVLLADDSRQSVIDRLLASRAPVALGLASYSLYLWHVPVLAYLRYVLIREPGPAATGAALAVTAALAFASWRFVEQPVRLRRVLAVSTRFVVVMITASALCVLVGVALWRSNGWPARFSAAVRALDPYNDSRQAELRYCILFSVAEIDAGKFCEYGPERSGVARAVVWGDSHAVALLGAYRELANRFGVHLYFAGHASCRPILYPPGSGRAGRRFAECDAYNHAMRRAIERLQPQLVILNSYWLRPVDARNVRPQTAAPLPVSLDVGVAAALARIAAPDFSTCVVLDPPTLAFDAPYALAMSLRRGIDPGFIRPTRAQAYAQYQAVETQLRRLEARPQTRIADPKEALCSDEICDVYRDGNVLYWDDNHLSDAGAARVEGVLARCFAALGPAATSASAPP